MRANICNVLLLVCFSLTTLPAQESEFQIYSNGLIYSEQTMFHLNKIVDSLNLKFKSCDLDRPYFAVPQAIGHFIRLDSLAIQAKADIEKGISFEGFVKKYTFADIDQNELILRYPESENYDKERSIEYETFSFNRWSGKGFSFPAQEHIPSDVMKGKWLFKFNPKSKYQESASISAFYFIEDFKVIPIPDFYARMVQYTDCMIDTNSLIFLEGAAERQLVPKNSAIQKFTILVNDFPGKPKYPKDDADDDVFNKYFDDYMEWNSLRLAWIQNELSKTNTFKDLLSKAVDEVMNKGYSGAALEEYVSDYLSKEMELELKRREKVVGSCSQDQRPRLHAQRIAVLAAETAKWEIFLRAHLDIMNDRFERVTDGSYAWGRRQTYIRELEELGINVPDLLLGISLRIHNPSQNHYFGSITRVGRALAETQHAAELEQKMLDMIADNTLDYYNRLLIYYLFSNYSYYLEDEARKLENKEKLEQAMKTFPAAFIEKLQKED